MTIESAQAHTYLAAIVINSDDAIIAKNLNGNITSWNPAAERIFGYPADEAIGKHISLIIPAERMGEEDHIISRLRKGERIDHFETERRTRSGKLVPISITVSPIRNDDGVVVGASKIARDISDRVEHEKQMREVTQKKDEFLTNMSHELRTPMNAVIGLANILKNSKTLSDRDRNFVETLKMSADNLLALINDLLDFAKIEAGTIQLDRVAFDLSEVLDRVMKVNSVAAETKKLNMRLVYPSHLPQVFMGDPLRVQQIVMNLVSNAVKFTERGSITVEVSGSEEQPCKRTDLAISVTDTGIGIAPHAVDSIFDKFVQGDASITRRFGGSGLGLSITKAFADHMGGSIHVTSQLGIGTRFTVCLPLDNTDQPDKADRVQQTSSKPAQPVTCKNVLLVEDYQPNVLVAGTMLEEQGYDYDVADNGTEAIRLFLQRDYDVILMDVQMHELDGMEATRRIRKMEADHGRVRTPIIAMTAHVREQDKHQCIDAGMDDFLPKPFEPRMLSEKIEHYRAAKEDQRKLA